MENPRWHIEGIPDEAVWAGIERGTGFLNELKVYTWMEVGEVPNASEIFAAGWVFKVNADAVRAILVLKQSAMRGGNKSDTYAPTPSPTSVRVLLAFSALMRMAT